MPWNDSAYVSGVREKNPPLSGDFSHSAQAATSLHDSWRSGSYWDASPYTHRQESANFAASKKVLVAERFRDRMSRPTVAIVGTGDWQSLRVKRAPDLMEKSDFSGFNLRHGDTDRESEISRKTGSWGATGEEEIVDWVSYSSRIVELYKNTVSERRISCENSDVSPNDSNSTGGAVEYDTEQEIDPLVKVLKDVLDAWNLGDECAVPMLGFDPTEQKHVDNMLQGRVRMKGRDIRDRISCLLDIRRSLHGVFRDVNVENKWLRSQQELLDGQVPMYLLMEGSMDNLILVKEYVNFAART